MHINLDTPILEGTLEEKKLLSAWKIRQKELQGAVQSVLKPAEYMANLTKQLQDLPRLSIDEKKSIFTDLESLLTDIDNARDFHTIGAWSILVAHLHPTYPMSIRALASWCLGTAIKNAYDYQLWVLEPVELTIQTFSSKLDFLTIEIKPTALDLLLDMINSPSVGVETLEFHKRALYAISSATRGNVDVQEQILLSNTSFLNRLHDLCLETYNRSVIAAPDLVRKVFSLAADMTEEYHFILTELENHTVLDELHLMGKAFVENDEKWMSLATNALRQSMVRINGSEDITAQKAVARTLLTFVNNYLMIKNIQKEGTMTFKGLAGLEERSWINELKLLTPHAISAGLGLEDEIVKSLLELLDKA